VLGSPKPVRADHTGVMELDTAHLSSLSSALEDLSDRITALANGYQGSPREDVAADLYDVERNLQAAHRRLRALVAKL
jgi:Mg2+ and Co2+ transporter CorA